MPELPEVETVRRSLLGRIVGRRIVSCDVTETRLRRPLDAAALARDVVGARVEDVRRRSKYVLVDLEGERVLVAHLGMSGRLGVVPADAPRQPHEHVRFGLEGGDELRFRDPRRFGLLAVLARGTLPEDPLFSGLGPEPFDEAFSAATLARAARGSRRPVKNLLMDAGVVVGVGNIYAAEALHRAGIHPARAAGRIAPARLERLVAAIREVLAAAIASGGTTLSDFRDADGAEGWFQVTLAVYGREGQPCPRCATPIRRIVQANRSTWYCPRCQR